MITNSIVVGVVEEDYCKMKESKQQQKEVLIFEDEWSVVTPNKNHTSEDDESNNDSSTNNNTKKRVARVLLRWPSAANDTMMPAAAASDDVVTIGISEHKKKRSRVAEEEEEAKKKSRKTEMIESASSSSDDDNEDEAPRKLPQNKQTPKKAAKKKISGERKKEVLKKEVQEWVSKSDHVSLSANATNARGVKRAIYRASRFTVPGTKLGSMTTLRLAMLYAFRASKSDREGWWEASLKTLETLMTTCGVNISETEKVEELLEFLMVKLPEAVPDSRARCPVFATLLEEDTLYDGATSTMEAVARLLAIKQEDMLEVLLRARRDVLGQAEIFETITLVMKHCTPGALPSMLQIFRTKIGAETRHPLTGSTLLHFAAKRGLERLVKEVRPFCDAAATDNKGRTAAYYLQRLDASEELLALVR
jgi:hypothetical protein